MKRIDRIVLGAKLDMCRWFSKSNHYVCGKLVDNYFLCDIATIMKFNFKKVKITKYPDTADFKAYGKFWTYSQFLADEEFVPMDIYLKRMRAELRRLS